MDRLIKMFARIIRRPKTLLVMGMLFVAQATLSPAAMAQDARGPYLLGPNDIIDIGVFRQPDLSIQVRIQSDSTILMPVVGKILVGDRSEQEAALQIQRALTEGGVIRDAAVVLRVLEFASKQVSVLGYANSPGAFYLDRPSQIADLLAKASGATAEAADYLVFSDYDEATGQTTRTEILISEVLGVDGSGAEYPVGDRDVIFLPRAPVYYIYGAVGTPGAYRLEKGMTVEQALAKAGGVTELGDRNKIRRRDKSGEKKKLRRIDLAETVFANDVLYVGTSLF